MSADWALVVFSKPLLDAASVEEMSARELRGLVFEILAADRAPRELLPLAVLLLDLHLL